MEGLRIENFEDFVNAYGSNPNKQCATSVRYYKKHGKSKVKKKKKIL